MEAQPRFLITGASGLLGSAITRLLDEQKIAWTALRHGEPGWDPAAGVFSPHHLEGITGVIHLAGENIASGRWTTDRKQRIKDSRVKGTLAIAKAIAGREQKPEVFLCASATGFFGNRGEEVLDEHSAHGEGFLPEIVTAWEQATKPASDAGVRVVCLRLGIILAREGGALKKMLPPFRMGAGGPLGNGRMWMSWIHVEDAATAFVQAATSSEFDGAYNLVSPAPVRNKDFSHALGRALRRPAILPLPAFMIRLMFGEMGETLLLASTRVLPRRLDEHAFAFQHPELDSALEHLL